MRLSECIGIFSGLVAIWRLLPPPPVFVVSAEYKGDTGELPVSVDSAGFEVLWNEHLRVVLQVQILLELREGFRAAEECSRNYLAFVDLLLVWQSSILHSSLADESNRSAACPGGWTTLPQRGRGNVWFSELAAGFR
jgi:hypothetical protein